MTVDRNEPDSTHELRLEGIGLLLGGGFLLAVLVGAFFLGRWVERSGAPPASAEIDSSSPLAQVTTREPDADAAEGLTYFDRVAGEDEEPARELSDRPASSQREQPSTPDPPRAAKSAAPDGGAYYVQVAAVRDPSSAAELVDSLEKQGYGVRLVSEQEGQGMLYKVRVGGYGTDGKAREVAAELKSAGFSGAWVSPLD